MRRKDMRNTLAPTLPDSSLTAFYVSPVFTVPDACLIRAFEILFSPSVILKELLNDENFNSYEN